MDQGVSNLQDFLENMCHINNYKSVLRVNIISFYVFRELNTEEFKTDFTLIKNSHPIFHSIFKRFTKKRFYMVGLRKMDNSTIHDVWWNNVTWNLSLKNAMVKEEKILKKTSFQRTYPYHKVEKSLTVVLSVTKSLCHRFSQSILWEGDLKK